MATNTHPPFRTAIHALILGLIAALILAACSGGGPGPLGEAAGPASPTQLPTQVRPPTQARPPTQTQPPAETLAPTGTQAAAATPAQPAENGISACALITKEEAEEAVGGPVGEPVEENYPPLYGCDYRTTGINEVGISLVAFEDAEQAGEAFQMEIDINKYPEINGIGDRALRPEIMDISVIKGRYELSINVLSDEEKEVRYEKAKALALLALGRLP